MKLPVKNIQGQDQGELEVKIPLIENNKGTRLPVIRISSTRSGTAAPQALAGEDIVNGTNKRLEAKGLVARASRTSPRLSGGGGVVFGPKPRDFSKKVSRATRHLALLKALSERLKAGDVLIVDDLKLSNGKTKEFVSVLKALDVKGSVLVSSPEDNDQNLARTLAADVADVELTTGEALNTYQLLRSDKALFTRGAFEHLEHRLKKD